MKKMYESEQMQANGGAWVHCADCGTNIWGSGTKEAAANFMNYHKDSAHRFWGYGLFEDCPNCH